MSGNSRAYQATVKTVSPLTVVPDGGGLTAIPAARLLASLWVPTVGQRVAYLEFERSILVLGPWS